MLITYVSENITKTNNKLFFQRYLVISSDNKSSPVLKIL